MEFLLRLHPAVWRQPLAVAGIWRQAHGCDWPDMNHVEAHVLDFVAQLYPQAFTELATYRANNAGYLDATIRTFDREVQFYLAYRGYVDICKAADLCFCYPRVSSSSQAVRCDETFDLALAHKLVRENAGVVRNDFHLERACAGARP